MSIISSVLSTSIEIHLFFLGIFLGLVIGLLWPRYKTAAIFLLGFTFAMTLGQSLSPWSPGYSTAVYQRPLAMKPWYVLIPEIIIIAITVPFHRMIKRIDFGLNN